MEACDSMKGHNKKRACAEDPLLEHILSPQDFCSRGMQSFEEDQRGFLQMLEARDGSAKKCLGTPN